jgi:hypothetical protein
MVYLAGKKKCILRDWQGGGVSGPSPEIRSPDLVVQRYKVVSGVCCVREMC